MNSGDIKPTLQNVIKSLWRKKEKEEKKKESKAD